MKFIVDHEISATYSFIIEADTPEEAKAHVKNIKAVELEELLYSVKDTYSIDAETTGIWTSAFPYDEGK